MNPLHSSPPVVRSVVGRINTSYPRILDLLVPLDFSGKSRQALRYAMPIAQKFAARIHLVHVVTPRRQAERADPARLQAEAQRRLDALRPQLLPARFRGQNLVRVGEPAQEILAVATKLDADLILLTTKRRSGLRRILLGGTAEYVMRHARCPVMSIPRH